MPRLEIDCVDGSMMRAIDGYDTVDFELVDRAVPEEASGSLNREQVAHLHDWLGRWLTLADGDQDPRG